MVSKPWPIGALKTAWYHALSKPQLSELVCRIADLRLPQPVMRGLITAYCAAFDVNMKEAQIPSGGFETFNAFFTRALVEGARTVHADPTAIVSPADSRLAAMGPIGPALRLEAIKGRDYSLAALLADAEWAKAMTGGTYATLYLSPRDYHRVHSPCAGVVSSIRHIDGARFPVMPAAIQHVDELLARNARTVVRLDTEHFGSVAVVLVGATNVSRISIATREGASITAGSEIGAFNLGSTVVLAVERAPRSVSVDARIGEMIEMGQAILTS